MKTSFDWLELDSNTADPSLELDSSKSGLAFVSGTLRKYTSGSWSDATGSGSSTFVGLSDTPANFTSGANKFCRVNAAGNAVEFDTLSGDVTVAADGALSITAGAIVNADINASAAIAWSKMASAADISSTGTVTDLTITSEAQGDVLYNDGTNWVRLAAGTSGTYLQTQGASANPQWASVTSSIANGLNSPFTIEGVTYDPATTVTTQTSSAAALTIPNLAGVAQEWVFSVQAVTLLNKTLDDATCKFGDTADATKDLFFSLGGATTAKTMTIVSSQTDDRSLTLPDGTDTLVGKATTDDLTNKTLSAVKIATTDGIFDASGDEFLKFVADTTPVGYVQITSGDAGVSPMIEGTGESNSCLMLKGSGTGNVEITDGGDITAKAVFELDGATTASAMTFVISPTVDRTLTLPDATDTLVGKATTDVFTQKSFDCDGSGNALTNVNATELDPIGDAAFGIPFIIQKSVANLAVAGTNIIGTHPKMRILDVWFVHTSADSGTLAVKVGQNGSVGATITDTITIAAGDKDITRAGELDDAAWDVAANGGLVAIGDGGNSVDGVVFVLAMRIN